MIESAFSKIARQLMRCTCMHYQQAWAAAWRRGELLAPPECGHDLRLIRTVAPAAPAEAVCGQPPAVEQLLLPPAPPGGSGAADADGGGGGGGTALRSPGAACAAALSQGFSVALRQLCHRWAPAAALAEALEAQLGLPAGGNAYCTPPGGCCLLTFCCLSLHPCGSCCLCDGPRF